MSRLISDILAAPEPHFSHAIKSWEQLTGHNGHDIRLVSDVSRQRKSTLQALQLDESDTTAHELYYSLRHRALGTNEALEKHIKVTSSDTPQQVVNKVVAFIESVSISIEVWTIKHAVVKQLLKKQPPKKLMKALGLRSIDSVLKRSSSYELLALAYQLESTEWTAKMHAQFKKLKPTDFQSVASTIYQVESDKVDKLIKCGYHPSKIIIPNYETGTIAVLLPNSRFKLDTLALTMSLLQMLYELRVYSAYFRHCSVKQSFSSDFYKAIIHGLPGKLYSNQIGWKALQKHFNQQPESFNRIEQPQLEFNDIHAVQPVTALATLVPEAAFWSETDYLFLPDKKRPVSFHLMDVIVNASNQVPYEQSTYYHLQARLWEELSVRYLQHESIETLVIGYVDQLNDV